MIELNRVTIVCIDCRNYGAAVSALQKCNEQVKAERVVLLTDVPLQIKGIEVVLIPKINSKEDYSRFILKELYTYFDTEFVLVVQHDGYIIDAEMWSDEFYNYDYIGASWIYEHGRNVGNGGFSLRSKKLQTIVATDELINITGHEDQTICIIYGEYLTEKYRIKFAPEKIADKFSFELKEPINKTFGFHGNFHNQYRKTVVIKRTGALGDCLILEPVLRYYAIKGYNIVLDIPASFFELYSSHYFPVRHISLFDSGRVKAEKNINLDKAYECKPRQSYLKSYFEFCGIEDYQLSRPQLFPLVDEKTKLFKKYAVIHNDWRQTEHRNIYGVDWSKVRKHLETLGYVVLQIGKNEHELAGIEINTQAIGFMKYVISGCDLFLGCDSAPAGIAVAYNKKAIIFFGSVCPDYVHPDLTNVEIIQGDCSNAFCWHVVGGESGQECLFKNTEKYLQCCKATWEDVVDRINILEQK